MKLQPDKNEEFVLFLTFLRDKFENDISLDFILPQKALQGIGTTEATNNDEFDLFSTFFGGGGNYVQSSKIISV